MSLKELIHREIKFTPEKWPKVKAEELKEKIERPSEEHINKVLNNYIMELAKRTNTPRLATHITNIDCEVTRTPYLVLDPDRDFLAKYQQEMDQVVRNLFNKFAPALGQLKKRNYQTPVNGLNAPNEDELLIYLCASLQHQTKFKFSFDFKGKEKKGGLTKEQFITNSGYLNHQYQYNTGSEELQEEKGPILITTYASPVNQLISLPEECIHATIRPYTTQHIRDKLKETKPIPLENGKVDVQPIFDLIDNKKKMEEGFAHALSFLYAEHLNNTRSLGIPKPEFDKKLNQDRKKPEYHLFSAALEFILKNGTQEATELYKHSPEKIF